MALDPKKWTVKTQEAFAAAIDLAKGRFNPELTPDHLLVALAEQEGTVVASVLAKLGQSPGMVRDRALGQVERLPQAHGGDEPRMGRELNQVTERATQFRKDLNESLADFLLRACANDRTERFQTAAEMRSALESVRASL